MLSKTKLIGAATIGCLAFHEVPGPATIHWRWLDCGSWIDTESAMITEIPESRARNSEEI
jgi:hypothetical protein